MQIFVMHVGHPGHVDIDKTVKRTRSRAELLAKLPASANERAYFESDTNLKAQFPDDKFNCWGVPRGAAKAFESTQIGDVVLMIPWIGVHGGGIQHLGVVTAKCPVEALEASNILWPNTPLCQPYPWIFFFQTETGFRDWYDFLDDVGYEERWNPRGWYRRVAPNRFRKWSGAAGYLQHLRQEGGFSIAA